MKRKPKGKARRPGRVKVLPADWTRRAWSVAPWTVYAIDVLARREQIPSSVLVDRVLTAYCKRQRDKIPAAPRGMAGPGNGD
ncbi:MAG: hypothetical protein Q8R92_09125 [Deltaproteobacteria bacterium]|nr:hypothetical protein [Deltaproteobacteria bacterium]